jgi:hypothetical protein
MTSSTNMTALTEHQDTHPSDAQAGVSQQLRERIQHQRAKRLDRRDPSRSLTKKRIRHEILSRV